MTESAPSGVSPRSFLIAGVSAAVVGAAAVMPIGATELSPATILSDVRMTSITTPLEVAIKNTYNFVEPWAAYGAAWGEYILGLPPGLWWVAPGVPFAYYTTEPLVQAGVYSFADVVGLNFAQIGPDINSGISSSPNNAATYGLAWLNSLVPFPPVPPIPPLPGAAVAPSAAAPAAATSLAAAPAASAVTTSIEDAIKNTYNAVEPWVAYGFELSQWVLGFVPGLWWIAPGVDLAYFTIEPLVRAGVYTVADVLGLDFDQIGPDINAGIQTSINNAVTYGLAWLNSLVPFPPLPPFPPRPSAAVDVAAVSASAAAAVQTAALEADASTARNSADAATDEFAAPAAEAPVASIPAAPAEDAPAAKESALVDTAQFQAPSVDDVPVDAAEAAEVAAVEAEAPEAEAAEVAAVEAEAVEAEAVEAEAVEAEAAELAAEVAAPTEAPSLDATADTATPAEDATSASDTADNSERPSRGDRSASRG